MADDQWILRSMLATNVLPLVAMVLWGWGLYEIAMTYWVESAVVGLIGLLKFITCGRQVGVLKRLILLPPALVFYLMISLPVGGFIAKYLGPNAEPLPQGDSASLDRLVGLSDFTWPMIAVGIGISTVHLHSYVFGFLLGPGRTTARARDILLMPFLNLVPLIFLMGFVLRGTNWVVTLVLFAGLRLLADSYWEEIRRSRRWNLTGRSPEPAGRLPAGGYRHHGDRSG